MPNIYLIYWARLTDSPPLPPGIMLTFYPEDDIYIVGTPEKGYNSIDKDSQAFTYCEYLRSNFGTTEAKDPEGDYYLTILVSEYRVDEIQTFVRLENSFRYLMAKGL